MSTIIDTKVQIITNTKLYVAVVFLGISMFAAGLVGISTSPRPCFDDNECKETYLSCVKIRCTSRMGYNTCKKKCLTDVYNAFEKKKLSSVCGNGVVDVGEVCDILSKSCIQSCKLKVYPVSMGTKVPVVDQYTFLVKDQDDIPLKNAYVKFYEQEEYGDSLFPLEEPTTQLRFEGFTNDDGLLSIPSSAIGAVTFDSLIIVEKDGYLGTMWGNAAYNSIASKMSDFGHISFTLEKLTTDDTYTGSLAPVFVMSHPKLGPYLERTNRISSYTVVPSVREDLMKDVTSVDLTLHIAGYAKEGIIDGDTYSWDPIAKITPASEDTHLEITKENIELGTHNSFDIFLGEEGMYYPFFEFTLYKSDVSETFYYFPKNKFFDYLLPEWLKAFMDTHGYQFFPKSAFVEDATFAVLDESVDVSFEPVIAEHNDDDSRVNVVFFGVDFDSPDFVEAAKFITTDDYLSLTGVHPFVENTDAFNYWYYPEILSVEEASWTFSDSSNILTGKKDLSKIQQIMMQHTLNGKIVVILLVNDDTLPMTKKTEASSGKCNFLQGVHLAINKNLFDEYSKTMSYKETFTNLDLGRVALHEFGHEIGLLGEEYVGNPLDFFDHVVYQKDFVKKFNPSLRSNSYYGSSDFKSTCYRSKYSYSGKKKSKNNFIQISKGGLACKADDIDYCEDASWSDMIGNGCGVDGVVDCTTDDSDFYKEVVCHSGSGQTGAGGKVDLLKPTFSSIMHSRVSFNLFYDDDKHPYGLYNEKVICDDIKMYTGKACK